MDKGIRSREQRITRLPILPALAVGKGVRMVFDPRPGLMRLPAYGVTTLLFYVADSANHTIRKIAIATGEVTTIAGAPGPAASVDGAGTTARFGFVEGLWGDGTYLFVSDFGNRTIRKIEIASGNVTTLAGSPGVQALVDGT